MLHPRAVQPGERFLRNHWNSMSGNDSLWSISAGILAVLLPVWLKAR
jgi:hypothetical protein